MKPRIKRMLLLTAGLIIIMYGIPNLAFYLLPKWIDALVGIPLAFFLLYKFLMWWESKDRVQYFYSVEDEFGDDAYSWVGEEGESSMQRMYAEHQPREFNLQAEQKKIAEFFDRPGFLDETEGEKERREKLRMAEYPLTPDQAFTPPPGKHKKRPMLYLNVKRKWFTMIVAGIKKEEYRQIKPYYERIIRKTHAGNMVKLKGELYFPEDIAICFANGYAKDRRKVCVTCTGLRVGEGKPEWGAKPGEKYFVFGLGDFISYEMPEDEPSS